MFITSYFTIIVVWNLSNCPKYYELYFKQYDWNMTTQNYCYFFKNLLMSMKLSKFVTEYMLLFQNVVQSILPKLTAHMSCTFFLFVCLSLEYFHLYIPSTLKILPPWSISIHILAFCVRFVWQCLLNIVRPTQVDTSQGSLQTIMTYVYWKLGTCQ